jgi:hypothetical protein
MSEESKVPETPSEPSSDGDAKGPVDNVMDEILETVGGMNAMLEALDKSRPHLQEAGKVFLTALAKATEEARETAEASAGAEKAPEDPAAKRGAELAAKFFGAIDKVAKAAAPDPNKDPDAAEFEEAAANSPADLGARLAGALDHALGVAADKLGSDLAKAKDSEDGDEAGADEPDPTSPAPPPEASKP